MIGRHRALLKLISNEGGRATKLRLVKLNFLVSQQADHAPSGSLYEFFPYHHGPFSFTLYHELRTLERDGWLRVLDHEIVMAKDPDAEIARMNPSLRKEVDDVSREYRGVPTDTLISHVYRDFPWYTLNSQNLARRAATAPIAPPAVYSVGYEGMMLDGLLDLLLKTGITRLIDVRCNPVARRFGFHKSTLLRHCHDVGIAYVHLPELGIPSSWRASLDDLASYERLFERYETEILPAQRAALQSVGAMLREQPSAMMCLEANPVCCHRTRLARAVAKLTSLPLRELRRA